MTNTQRADAIGSLGYTEREAGFLCLAALHGGYFLRRQFCQFLGKGVGGTAAALIEKALAKRHIKVATYNHNTHLYHLCRRPFYAALGQVDNRNRRERQPSTIKNKLMGLDFVLIHYEHQFLATEQEKVDFFTGTLKIEQSNLPARIYRSPETAASTTRYFVDKYPIFIPATASPASPVVSFCFVDEGAATVSGFETHLDQYKSLFTSLPHFEVVYVAAHPAPFRVAETIFERFVAAAARAAGQCPIDPRISRMLAHFADRRLYEMKQLGSFDRGKLIRFREERQEFSGYENEALFECWKVGGTRAVMENLTPKTAARAAIQGTFSTELLRQNYDLFGGLTAF